ncbi:MAG TPA: hypothetical protein VHS81_09465 [Caulobacteraceae bacterium]|nr:hypothetical protein [Caulobacteraceae bacterium]
MRRFLLWLALIGVVVVAGAVVFLMWDLDWRWRPATISKNQTEIGQALDQSGWVSPHLTGPKVYVIAYRNCQACAQFEQTVLPKLQAAEVDTRVIMVARADVNGQALSTPAERATVAELWTNRSWKLFQQWLAASPQTWTAPAIPPADGDAARTAVVEAGRLLVRNLTPQLSANGVRFAYPMVIWWTKDGHMRACACASPQSWRFVEKDLGA